jgi:hypothetical protein
MKAEEPTHEDVMRNANNVTSFTRRASSIFFHMKEKINKCAKAWRIYLLTIKGRRQLFLFGRALEDWGAMIEEEGRAGYGFDFIRLICFAVSPDNFWIAAIL